MSFKQLSICTYIIATISCGFVLASIDKPYNDASGIVRRVILSQNTTCGAFNGSATCVGTSFGSCCSQFGFCGSTSLHCGTGCQSGYGNCGSAAISSGTVVVSSTSSSNGSSVTTATASSTSSTATCGSPTWQAMGCYYDAVSNRQLANRQNPSGTFGMTIETCLRLCASKGYVWAGLEYYGECYCDQTIGSLGKPPSGDGACDTTSCNGNGTESCGGPDRLNAFFNTAGFCTSPATSTTSVAPAPFSTSTASLGWSYAGCYSDSVYNRGLIVSGPKSGSMTVESCQQYCIALNYIYAGVEYSTECYCGRAILSSSVLSAESGCNMACGGNGSETCGGPDRLSVYYYNAGNITSATTSSATPAQTAGIGPWAPAYVKANAAMAGLDNNQKIGMVTGTGWQRDACVGNTASVPSIGYPALCLQDGPLGVRYLTNGAITAFPAGIHVASTWDRALMYSRGNALGVESKALGINALLGPVCGPMGKIPQGGRGWEGFGPDPYLSGVGMVQTINGMQDAGVQAVAKHLLGNEQEAERDTINAIIPDRATHEVYLWPFAEAVKANVASVMCSYNQVNGSNACESSALLGLVKNELGFQGYIMSDWTAQKTTVNAALAGLDMSMPGNDFNGQNNFREYLLSDGGYPADVVIVWGQNLYNVVSQGVVPQSRLDDMVRRVLAAWYFVGQDSGYPTVSGWNSFSNSGGAPNVQGNHAAVARTVARDGVVLLKNTKGALPLNRPVSLALIGQNGFASPSGPNGCADRGCNVGHLAMGWGSGTAEFPYLIDPYTAIKNRVANTTLLTSPTDDMTQAATAAASAATAMVFISADSGEAFLTVEGQAGDRANLDPWHNGNALVAAAASRNPNTIVVINSVGPLILESIVANPNVTAIVWAGIAGQESGNGLADVLYGSVSPSGKLPYTLAKQASDYNTPLGTGYDNFAEGSYIDYRHFDQAGIVPRYEFGYGLSYTNFTYSSLTTSYYDRSAGNQTTLPGGASGLYDNVATITATITNSGGVAGAEVSQLYIGIPSPNTPSRQLRGFSKDLLQPGQSTTVTYQVRRKDLSVWDVGMQKWVVPSGTFGVFVGSSSRDIRLNGSM